MPAAAEDAAKKAPAGRAFSNGVSSKHLLFLLVFLAFRHGLPSVMGSSESHSREAAQAREGEGEGGGHGEEGEVPEYEVFHVDFEYVQLPFIISLWIFVSSLAKIGEWEFFDARA